METFPKPKRAGRLAGWLAWICAWALVALGAVFWWVWSGRVFSAEAALEAPLLAVRAPLSEEVESVPVRPGEAVRAGAPVLHLRGKALSAQAAEADPLCRPEGTQGGNAAAGRREQDVRTRLIIARHEEERLLQEMQESVARHARVQYVLRAAQASGKAPLPEQTRAEAEAQLAVTAAKARHEQVSHARAALSKEAEQLRNAPNTGKSGPRIPCPPTAAIVQDLLHVTAPVNGRVARVRARAGESVVQGDIVLEILPDTEKGHVLAWLPAEHGEKVKVGQPCVVRGEGTSPIWGKIAEVLPAVRREVAATGLRGQELRAKVGTEERVFTPVRVSMKEALAVLPDMPLQCTIYARSWPWLEAYLPLLP